MDGVVPSRITEAREARALSMQDFADSIGKTRQSVSKYERGIISPTIDVLQIISHKLAFPIDFFYKKEIGITTASSALFFRSKSSIAKKVKTACKYQVKWVVELKKQLENYLDFVDLDVPTINVEYDDLTDDDIEEFALSIRKKWDLGNLPIGDLIGVLENRGIVVSQFATNNICQFKGIDAFSSWKEGTPYIFYHPIMKSAVRTRFSILHELGHLVMHSAILDEDSVKKEVCDFADSQADRFAEAFLLPATSFPNDIRGTSLTSLEVVKRKWGAAFSTIIKRCDSLGLLSENQSNYLKRQMSTQKYWYKEPLDDVLTVKGPEIFRDAIYLLLNEKVLTKDEFLYQSAFPISDLKSICALPNDFFDDYINRQKPILKVLP